MEWEHICQDSDMVTEAMVVGSGALVRVISIETENTSMTFVPGVEIRPSSCGERKRLVSRNEGKRGLL